MTKLRTLAMALCLGTASAWADTVVVTATDVSSALDIEAAIAQATRNGTVPGTVVLDGRDGPFHYAGADRSINLAVSNLTLRGIDGATLDNCGDGVFFDDVPVRRIRIEGITFQCEGNGINRIGGSLRSDVLVRRNVFEAANHGAEIENGLRWTIEDNVFQAGPVHAAVALLGCRDSSVVNNGLAGFRGVWLTDLPAANQGIMVAGNRIEADETGVGLDGQTFDCAVTGNRIVLAGGIGVRLGPGTFGNEVHGNTVTGGTATVEDSGQENGVSGNRP